LRAGCALESRQFHRPELCRQPLLLRTVIVVDLISGASGMGAEEYRHVQVIGDCSRPQGQAIRGRSRQMNTSVSGMEISFRNEQKKGRSMQKRGKIIAIRLPGL
jgi:hypothetical protein